MFLDQLIIGDKKSYEHFEASVKDIRIKDPEKKEVKETVPFSNVTYDFSMIDGELYWKERDIEVDFEIMADTPEELVVKKAAFDSWVMNVFDENIYSPYDPDFHYVGTYNKKSYADESNKEKTVATVVFKVYPYKIANVPKLYHIVIPAGSTVTEYVVNNSAHRLTPTIISGNETVIQYGNASYGVPNGEMTDDCFRMPVGVNEFTIQNPNEEDCTVTIRFYEEVF